MLTENDWAKLRDIRLAALSESPKAFLSNFEYETAYTEEKWRAEFARGEWVVVVTGNQMVGLLGVTREPDMPLSECYLEYMWVSPRSRRAGVASMLLRTVLDHLRRSGIATVWLWILEGNEQARRVYEKFGFLSTNERQALKADPERSEERMKLSLLSGASASGGVQ